MNAVCRMLAIAIFLICADSAGADLRQVAQLKNTAFEGSYGQQLAYSPDGNLIAVGRFQIGIWDSHTGKKLLQLDGHARGWTRGGVSGLVFMADSKTLISSGHDGAVRFWNTANGKLLREFSCPGFWVLKGFDIVVGRMPLHSLEYNSNNHLVAAVAHDWTTRLWDARTGKYLGSLGESRAERVDANKFNGAGRQGDSESHPAYWQMPVFFQSNHPTLCFSPDGETLAATEYEHAHLWNVDDRKLRLTIHSGGRAQFSPDGNTFVTGNYGGVTVWDPKTGKKILEFSDKIKIFPPLRFSPDGSTLATGSQEANGIRLWDFPSAKLNGTIQYGARPLDEIRFSPDGHRIAATVRRQQVHVFEVETGRKLFGDAHTSKVNKLAFTADGRYLISGGYDGSVKVWNAQTWRLTSSLTQPNMFVSALFPFPSSKQILVGDSSGVSRLLKVPSLESVLTFTHAEEQVSNEVVGYALFENRLFVGIDDVQSAVEIWDWKTHKIVSRRQQHPTYHLNMSASRDQSIVATTDYDGNVVVWEKEPSNRIAEFQIAGNHAETVAVTPDGKKLATVGWSGARPILQIWETRSRKELARATPGGSGITEAVWSPKGSTLAIASMGAPGVYVFHVGKLKPIDGTRGLYSLAFSPDGRLLAAGNAHGQITVWDFTE